MPRALFNRAQEESDYAKSWPIQDIVYVAIVGVVMLAALLEWILWLAAFTYCLVQVYMKADEGRKWSTRILTVTIATFFMAMRLIFLPVMVVTLPLPRQVMQYFPPQLVASLQWFAFYAFALLLTLPWLACIYQVVKQDLGRSIRPSNTESGSTMAKVVIVMPCYNEEPDILLRTIDSLTRCNYPASCMHIFLSFDGDIVDDLYLNTVDKLGVPLTLSSYPQSIDLVHQQCRLTVSRFAHGGKRCCQKHTFKLIDRIYENYLRRHDDLFILFIDSDCILDKECIRSFLYSMEQPGDRTVLAQTGVITSTTKKHSLITILQDLEYIHGQLFERTIESGCGAVTCLPGALTIFRFSAFRQVSKWYFASKAEQCDDLFDYGKMHLGEDRWLTHLFMISSTQRYQIQMNTGALCKTEAVQTFRSLLKQRRRWFLGYVTNEVVMLTDVRLWVRYPFLMVLRLAQNTIRTTALLFFVMVISALTTSQKVANLPIGFIGVSLGINWALMLYFGLRLGRSKMLLYPLMFVINPFFNWLYMVYAVFTASQRTWGGPRADASKAEVALSVEQVVEQAALNGDEFEVEPETFKIISAAHRGHQSPTTILMPPTKIVGRFRAASSLPGGWFRHGSGSGVLGHGHARQRLRRRNISNSSWSTNESSQSRSPVRPRRLASIVCVDRSPENHRQDRTASQTEEMYSYGSTGLAESTESIQPHFDVPSRPIDPIVRKKPDQITSGSSQRSPLTSTKMVAPLRPQSTPLRRLNRRLGRSPLARKSFTYLAADQETISGSTSRHVRRRSSEEPRGRRRRRPSVSVDSRGRRRLSKNSLGSKVGREHRRSQ